jgi:ribosomal protein S14
LDSFRRKAFVKLELRSKLLKRHAELKSEKLVNRYNAQLGLVNLPRFSSRNKIQNRCTSSGRNRNVLKRVSSARLVFRSKAHFAYLPGCNRAS